MPAYALSRLTSLADWRFLAGAPLAMSVFAFFLYRSDKRSAKADDWRVPESTLHLTALLGGWPGAFLAQRVFRHKTAKVSFQFVFWTIVFVHELLALDSLLEWQFTREAIHAVKTLLS